MNQNSRTTFQYKLAPKNPQKATSGTKIGPQKVIFDHFINFAYFHVVFPLARAVFQMRLDNGTTECSNKKVVNTN